MTEAVEEFNCANCRFSDQTSRTVEYLCKRYPPLTGRVGILWPEVSETDWCGEHQWIRPLS